MSIDYQKLRLFGVYQQDRNDNLMLRVKIPAGFFTSDQADMICSLSEHYSNRILHLTSRGSIEFHWLRQENLAEIFSRLASVGLTTRGACGGAVRGISCSTSFASGFPTVQRVAQELNRHFAGNPDFEGLPKKFKVGIDAGYQNSRCLIQDLGLVMCEAKGTVPAFDIWCAGGLGREPQAAFLLEKAVPEEHLIHIIESVVQVYREHTPPPKRLKFLVKSIGETEFRKLLNEELVRRPKPVIAETPPEAVVSAPQGVFLEVPVFAGELPTERLHRLAAMAREFACGALAVTADQNIALLASTPRQAEDLRVAFHQSGILQEEVSRLPHFRVCPGNHECRMGLSPTRELARQVNDLVGLTGTSLTWAISGCPNSCSQPQLADIGIVTKKLFTAENGSRRPLFDVYRRNDKELGRCIAESLTSEELLSLIPSLY